MIRIFACAFVLCGLMVADADAQVLGRLFGRGGCSSGSCSSSGYSSTGTASRGSCTSGTCAAPVFQEQGFVAVETPAASQVAASNQGMQWDVAGERGSKSLVKAFYSDVVSGKRRAGRAGNPILVAKR